MENERLKKATALLSSNSFKNILLVDELKVYYLGAIICNIFDIHRSSYKYWTKRPKIHSK